MKFRPGDKVRFIVEPTWEAIWGVSRGDILNVIDDPAVINGPYVWIRSHTDMLVACCEDQLEMVTPTITLEQLVEEAIVAYQGSRSFGHQALDDVMQKLIKFTRK